MNKPMLLLASLVALVGCRSELPAADTVCLGLVNTNQPACEDRMCIKELQRVTIVKDDRVGPNVLACDFCSNLPPEQLSTDQFPTMITVQYTSDELVGFFHFDNRVTLDYSLANLRKYAATVNGWYNTHQGEMKFPEVPFEVVSFGQGKMRLRFTAPLHNVTYTEPALPYECGGFICTKIACSYNDTTAGADGDPGELMVDLTAPFWPAE